MKGVPSPSRPVPRSVCFSTDGLSSMPPMWASFITRFITRVITRSRMEAAVLI